MIRLSLRMIPSISGSIHVMCNPFYSWDTDKVFETGRRWFIRISSESLLANRQLFRFPQNLSRPGARFRSVQDHHESPSDLGRPTGVQQTEDRWYQDIGNHSVHDGAGRPGWGSRMHLHLTLRSRASCSFESVVRGLCRLHGALLMIVATTIQSQSLLSSLKPNSTTNDTGSRPKSSRAPS